MNGGTGTDTAGTLTRLVSVVVLVLAFMLTKPITLENVDPLLIVAAVIAAISAAALAWMIQSKEDLTWPSAVEIAQASALIAGSLAILAILRTVLPLFVGEAGNAILGLAFVVLLLFVFAYTDRGISLPAVSRGGNGKGKDDTSTSSKPLTRPDSTVVPTSDQPAKTTAAGSGIGSLSVTGTVVAIAVVFGYGALIVLLIQRSSVSAEEWARLVGLQDGLQAAAFAALGALIGVAIQGRATAAAQQTAVQAVSDADVAHADAAALASEADGKTEKLNETAAKLTEIERALSDEAVPERVREFPVDLKALGIRPLRELHGRDWATQDGALTQIRSLRDEVAKAANTRTVRRIR
jgi:hypothetical protein